MNESTATADISAITKHTFFIYGMKNVLKESRVYVCDL